MSIRNIVNAIVIACGSLMAAESYLANPTADVVELKPVTYSIENRELNREIAATQSYIRYLMLQRDFAETENRVVWESLIVEHTQYLDALIMDRANR